MQVAAAAWLGQTASPNCAGMRARSACSCASVSEIALPHAVRSRSIMSKKEGTSVRAAHTGARTLDQSEQR